MLQRRGFNYKNVYFDKNINEAKSDISPCGDRGMRIVPP
jgi:hypothetical protein